MHPTDTTNTNHQPLSNKKNDTSSIQHKTIFLIGPANSGKTTLFNLLTQSKHKTVNYPGTTVDYNFGKLKQKKSEKNLLIIDSPGIQSLEARSQDEEVTLKGLTHTHLITKQKKTSPDILILVIDPSQFQKNIILAHQLNKLNIPFIIGLSKSDLPLYQFNLKTLETLTNKPVIQFSSKTNEGIDTLLQKIQSTPLIKENQINLTQLDINPVKEYEWAEQLTSCVIQKSKNRTKQFDPDQIFLHPALGPILFIAIMGLFFWSIFAFAAPFMDAIDQFFSWLSPTLQAKLPSNVLTNFLIQGGVSGIGATLVFIPQIFILFFVIGLLESSGYLARCAIIVDKPLAFLGLSGKSFVPLLSGYACAIPAIMATRTIPNKKERFVTQFIIPLMSCSARLPVYGLLLSLLLIGKPSWVAGFSLTLIYLGSIAFSSITAAILGKIVGLKKQFSEFDIELPIWHLPDFKNTLLHSMDQTYSFIKKAGPIIFGISCFLWILSEYPTPETSFILNISSYLDPLLSPMGLDGRVGVALILSFAAREVFVSALAIIFSINETSTSFLQQIQTTTVESTQTPLFSTASIIGLIIFFIISMQCLATLAIAKKEMGNWKYPVIMTTTYVIASYTLAVITVQTLNFLGIQ